MTLASQLINSTSRVLQNVLKYFNGTIILTSFALLSAEVFPVIFILYLNDSEPAKFYLVHHCNTDINFQMFLNNCHHILSKYILALPHQYL